MVHLRACEERGGEAKPHVELTGRDYCRHCFKDAVTLRRMTGGWRVLLPIGFGR